MTVFDRIFTISINSIHYLNALTVSVRGNVSIIELNVLLTYFECMMEAFNFNSFIFQSLTHPYIL